MSSVVNVGIADEMSVFAKANKPVTAATIEIVGFAQACGFEIVAAGKGKNNPLKFDATPDKYEEEARLSLIKPRRNISPSVTRAQLLQSDAE